MKRPETAPHNRTCREAFPLLLLFWWFFLAKGIWLERRAMSEDRNTGGGAGTGPGGPAGTGPGRPETPPPPPPPTK